MPNRRMTSGRQIRTQLGLALAAGFVLLPIAWIVRLAFDGTLKTRPNDAALWPKSWSLANLAAAWRAPRADISFLHLLSNSLIVALSTAAIALVAGTLAAYVFARYRFA